MTERRIPRSRSSRATAAIVLVLGLVLGTAAGAIAFVVGPAGAGASAPESPEPSGSPSAASPSPTPTPAPVDLPADCSAWFRSVDTIGFDATVAPSGAEPLRRLQAPSDEALSAAEGALRCDYASPESDETAAAAAATFSAASLDLDGARALRTALLEAGANCGAVAGGVLCVAVMAFDVDDPGTYGRVDTHFFREGVWIAGALQTGELVPRENLFRNVVASIFADQP